MIVIERGAMMKLMDKLKNLFLDEEENETDDEENFPQFEEKSTVKKEHKKPSKDELPKVMRDTIKKEEKVELKIKPEELVTEKNLDMNNEKPKKINSFVDFDLRPFCLLHIFLDSVSVLIIFLYRFYLIIFRIIVIRKCYIVCRFINI